MLLLCLNVMNLTDEYFKALIDDPYKHNTRTHTLIVRTHAYIHIHTGKQHKQTYKRAQIRNTHEHELTRKQLTGIHVHKHKIKSH